MFTLCSQYVALKRTFESAAELEDSATTFPTLTVWMREAVRDMARREVMMADADMKKLSMAPKLVTKLYSRMTAYGNHFRCDDGTSDGMVTFDCGVASILIAQGTENGEVLGQIHYVGILKHIRVMDYGRLSTPIALMECDWVRNGVDEMGESTYKRDEAGFLLANFSCMLQPHLDPFVLPCQVQQVFYSDAYITGPWRVVLHREPPSRRTQVVEYGEFINTRVCVLTLEPEALLHPTTTAPNMVGAITLDKRETELAVAPLLRGDFGTMSDED